MFKFIWEVWNNVLCGFGSHAWAKWEDKYWDGAEYQIRHCAHCNKKQAHKVY